MFCHFNVGNRFLPRASRFFFVLLRVSEGIKLLPECFLGRRALLHVEASPFLTEELESSMLLLFSEKCSFSVSEAFKRITVTL